MIKINASKNGLPLITCLFFFVSPVCATDLRLICSGEVSGSVISQGSGSQFQPYTEVRTVEIIDNKFKDAQSVVFSDSEMIFESSQFLDLSPTLRIPIWSLKVDRYSGRIRQADVQIDMLGDNLYVALRNFEGVCEVSKSRKF